MICKIGDIITINGMYRSKKQPLELERFEITSLNEDGTPCGLKPMDEDWALTNYMDTNVLEHFWGNGSIAWRAK